MLPPQLLVIYQIIRQLLLQRAKIIQPLQQQVHSRMLLRQPTQTSRFRKSLRIMVLPRGF